MRKKLLSVVGAAILAGAGTAGWYWWTTGRFIETTDNAYIESDISVISPRVAGYVSEIDVVDNQLVRTGDVLLRIEDSEFSAKFAEADAVVKAQQAAIANIDSRLTLQRSIIDQAVARVAAAAADLLRCQLDFSRVERLQQNDFASRQRVDTARADLRKAEAALASGHASEAAERDQVQVLEASRREAEARVKQAEAARALARNDLDNAVIRTPVDGIVGNRNGQVGQYVKAGTQVMSIVPLPAVYVVANFKETQLAEIRPGQPADLWIDAFPGRKLEGRIESFAPASGQQFSLLPAENATGNFTKIVQRVPVRIAVPQDTPLAGRLRPGLSVQVAVDTRAPGDTPSVAGGVFGAVLARPVHVAGIGGGAPR